MKNSNIKFSVRLEEQQIDGSFRTCLTYIVFSRSGLVDSIMSVCEFVAADKEGSYLLKVFDDSCEYYRDIRIDCNLSLYDLYQFINIL